MTGFGRGSFENENLGVLIEIKSLNGRFLNIRLHSSQEIGDELDLKIRQKISERVLRGNIEVGLNYQSKKPVEFDINRPLIEGFLNAVSRIKEEFELSGNLELSQIAFLPKAVVPKQKREDDELERAVFKALEEALNQLEKMRRAEGRSLKKVILNHLKQVEKFTVLIEEEAKKLEQECFQMLKEKIEGILSKVGVGLDEARFAQEIVYLVERSDISEEIARLKGHVEHARSIISEESDVGRRLDFLSQELNREANTILSKTANFQVKQLALQMKNEIEKIKEQVQNVE
jgi:uncharacterized protein (TIGR00255 family)